MNTKRLCPNCQKPLAPDAPLGLCPECLIKAGFPSGTESGAEGGGGRREFVPPGVEEIGKFFPQLEILELIGKGGMGAVYRARQKELDRVVALKILPPDVSKDAAFAERFTREAKALAKLNHPNIVTLYEFGRANGLFFFLMEFVDGVNLRQLLHAGRLSSREALAIVPQLCDALQYAHDRGIVHRDIKPENILLDRRGQVKVADFGLAKLIVAEEALTPAPSHPMGQGEAACAAISEAGKVMGTPQYMAPEQVSHPREVDHRADIYALGMVFYQMLTGELPGKPIEPPSKKVLLDVRLDEVVLRALEKLPERRYQQVSELKTQVETIATSAAEGAPAASGTGVERVRQSLRIPATGMVIAAAIIALEALLSIFQPWQGDDSTGGLASVLARSAAALVIGAGAFHMRRIISYAWALTAALLLLLCALADGLIPLAVGPWSLGALFGAVFALWSLVLLLRKDSRTAFRESQPAGARSSAAWHRWWKPSSAFVAAVVLSLLVRAFVLAPFRVETDAANPEVPRLSHIFVLKLSKSFSPGDLVVYRREGKNRVGRVAVTDRARGMIELERLHEPPQLVPVSEVIGRVVFNTRAATTRPSAPAAEIGPATETNFFVGQAYFPNRDSIEITSVERTKEQLAVKGRYNLISVDTASLALYITSTNVSTLHEDPRQSMRISKGAGSFELVHPHPSSGLPHINMYAGGRPFAELYFGNKEEATEEARLVLGPRRSANRTGDAVGDNKRASDATNLLQILRVTNATTAAVLEKLSKNLPKGVTLAADQRTGQIILEGPADGVAAVIKQIEEVEAATQPPNAPAIGERRQLNQGPAPDGIAFGRATNGLAAALELLPAKSGFALGESIGVRFHIRNVSDTNIILSGASWRQDQADRVTIRDQNGQRLPVRHIWYSGLTPIQRSVLEPGQSVVFRSSSLEFVSEDADEKSVTHPVSNWVKAKPGRYMVSYRLHFPDLVEGNSPMPYDWQGDLETAPLTVVVQTTSSSNASNPNDTPERRFAPVVEVTLPSSELSPRFLNLSARQTYSSATTNFPLVEARRSGSGGLAIAIYNIHAYLVRDRARGMREFETQSAEEFIQSNRMAGMYTLPFERFSLFEIHKTNLPMTVLMPYAGYLQVTEIIDGKDPSIKVRYKLLEQVDREVPSQVGDRSGVDSHEAGLIRASDGARKFADPIATNNSFHNQPAVSFDLDLHDATGKLQLVVVTTMLIGQSDFVLGLVGSSVGTRVELHDMAEKTLLNEMWDHRSNRFEKITALPIDYGRKHYSCPVQLEFGRLDSRKLWGSYRFCAYLSGHVRLGGAERYFELVNSDRRIIFPTEGKEENPRELLGVDLNGDGKIDPDPDGAEIFALNETFQIGMNHYRLAQVDPVKLEVTFREVAEPDFVKAREILKRAFGLAGAFGETLEKKDDLKLAQNLATQVVEQIQSYNELVRGTPVEWPKTTVDAFMRLVKALQKGDWDGAKNDSDSGDDMTDSTHQLDYLAAIQSAQSFGPVIERTLPFGRRKGTPYCFDFESGNLIEPPGAIDGG